MFDAFLITVPLFVHLSISPHPFLLEGSWISYIVPCDPVCVSMKWYQSTILDILYSDFIDLWQMPEEIKTPAQPERNRVLGEILQEMEVTTQSLFLDLTKSNYSQ